MVNSVKSLGVSIVATVCLASGGVVLAQPQAILEVRDLPSPRTALGAAVVAGKLRAIREVSPPHGGADRNSPDA